MVNSSPAIFFDRDGVLIIPKVIKNKSYAPRKFSDFKLYPETKKCIPSLRKAGYKLIVVTNQPDIANNLITVSELNKMHTKLNNELSIDQIYTCMHNKFENCECRKPRIGMLTTAIQEHNINIDKSYLIGDRYSDIEAAKNINCKSIFIDRNYDEMRPVDQIKTVKSLYQAVNYILENSNDN